jgi:hypothetical protein
MRVRGFIHVLQALEPRLSEIVLAGGWAWYVYRKYLTGEWSLPGEFTLDVDLVVPRRLASTGPRLDEMLDAADFELEMERSALLSQNTGGRRRKTPRPSSNS